MGKWKFEIDLSVPYDGYRENEDLDALKTESIKLIKSSSAYDVFQSDLDCLIQQLQDAPDADEWDEAYEDLADFCDGARIWLITT